MPKHIVRQGECLASIARRYGLSWKAIHDAPENESFRKKRPNPNVIYPGDEVFIPEAAKHECVGIATGKKHTVRLRREKWKLRLVLRGHGLKPVEGARWTLELDDGSRAEGRTGADGLIEAPATANTRTAKLEVFGEQYELKIGHLDPITRVSGLQQRLLNLGYMPGPVDGVAGPRTLAALRAFQRDHESELDVTGRIDDNTRKRLNSLHDGDDTCPDFEDELNEGGDEDGAGADDPASPAQIDFDALFAALPRRFFESSHGGCDLDEPSEVVEPRSA